MKTNHERGRVGADADMGSARIRGRSHFCGVSSLASALLMLAAGCEANPNGALSVSGQIEAVSVQAGSKVGGRVHEVLVKEGDHVKAGDVLVRLEDDESQASVKAARAQVAQMSALLAKLQTGARTEEIRQAEAAVAQARERCRMAERGARPQEIAAGRSAADAARALRDDAKAAWGRAAKLYEEDAVSKQLHDQALHAFEAAEAQYQAALRKLELLQEGPRAEEKAIAQAALDQAEAALEQIKNGARKEDLDAARSALEAAAAQLTLCEARAKEMTIVSPKNAVVESVDVHPGDLIQPGPAVRLIDPDDLELIVYVSATALGRLKLGERVIFTTDSHGTEKFEGTIVHIAMEGEYTPRNLQTQEERVQQVFGIKIKLDSAGGKLKAGMTATVHLEAASEAS